MFADSVTWETHSLSVCLGKENKRKKGGRKERLPGILLLLGNSGERTASVTFPLGSGLGGDAEAPRTSPRTNGGWRGA